MSILLVAAFKAFFKFYFILELIYTVVLASSVWPCIHIPMHVHAQLSLWVPTDCRPPGSSVHEIFQARILEWVAISSSRTDTYICSFSNSFPV